MHAKQKLLQELNEEVEEGDPWGLIKFEACSWFE